MNAETIKDHNDRCENGKAELRAKGTFGEWDNEPNRVNWTHNGLDCMAVRNYSGLNWCGYVGVKPGHPAFGKGYDHVQSGKYNYDTGKYDEPAVCPNVEVHGGLYAGKCGGFICHTTDDPKDETWWLGFDCAHSGDISPKHYQRSKELGFRSYGETYRNLKYVKSEIEALARQPADSSADSNE